MLDPEEQMNDSFSDPPSDDHLGFLSRYRDDNESSSDSSDFDNIMEVDRMIDEAEETKSTYIISLRQPPLKPPTFLAHFRHLLLSVLIHHSSTRAALF